MNKSYQYIPSQKREDGLRDTGNGFPCTLPSIIQKKC